MLLFMDESELIWEKVHIFYSWNIRKGFKRLIIQILNQKKKLSRLKKIFLFINVLFF